MLVIRGKQRESVALKTLPEFGGAINSEDASRKGIG
jgi:hypothetical protein